VRSKRQPDGRWRLDRIHPGRVYFDLEGDVGAPRLEHPPRAPGGRLVGPRGACGDVTPQPRRASVSLTQRPWASLRRSTRDGSA
jgi:hypothetical protein